MVDEQQSCNVNYFRVCECSICKNNDFKTCGDKKLNFFNFDAIHDILEKALETIPHGNIGEYFFPRLSDKEDNIIITLVDLDGDERNIFTDNNLSELISYYIYELLDVPLKEDIKRLNKLEKILLCSLNKLKKERKELEELENERNSTNPSS